MSLDFRSIRERHVSGTGVWPTGRTVTVTTCCPGTYTFGAVCPGCGKLLDWAVTCDDEPVNGGAA